MKKNTVIIGIIAIILVSFFVWRFIRPMNIFIVLEAFERPTDTSMAPAMFPTLSAKECATCHSAFYDEWNTSIHSQAWTDPYFQVDWRFDGSPQNCKNCHIPLDRQQEHKVLGFYDEEKWDPILEPNPDFDAKLQHEGVTCNVCHYQNGKIVGVLGNTMAPHPVEKIQSANQICIRCHVVSGKKWDTFFRFPPCGTVAEIQTTKGKTFVEDSKDMSIEEIASLGCVDCHMPLMERPLVPGGAIRATRQHTWRGGHDPAMVKQGLTIAFNEKTNNALKEHHFTLSITNTGADHYIPTGTPDRHLTVQLRAIDQTGNVLHSEHHTLKRTVMWRPFIIDLWDTRLPPGEKREYTLTISNDKFKAVKSIEAEVRYHLLDESRRRRINYENKTPINYSVFKQQIQKQSTP